ncbi:MAG TPA: RNA polymerase sigma factor [Rhodopseudomonas sp.]|uniref:RNA polymerase sigma factor n=1 Tax=Rhodopseudomonas sp. TaxID=1078 RepID=UPI002ED8A855
MSDSDRRSLRAALSADYEGLARRLTRCLGSSDLAREALHETFLRVDRVTGATPVHSPIDYLFRAAINVAKDRRRSDSLRDRLSAGEIAAICDIPDDRPDPSAALEARLEIEELDKALRELPKRRRAVFLAANIEQMPHSEIAKRFGVNVRTIEFDLRHAMEHLSRRLGRKPNRRYGPRPKDPGT